MSNPKHPHAKCEECPLARNTYYQQPIDTTAEYLYVGSGPTDSEGFKGGFLRASEAGQLINAVNNIHGISLEDVTYTTAVRCSGLSDLKLTDKRKAINACNGALFSDIDAVDPAAVVALGGEAHVALTGDRKAISSARVGPAKYNETVDAVLVPTVSPWACIQNESQFQFLVTDIAKLVHQPPVFTPPEWELLTTEAEALAVMDKLILHGVLGGDLTTDIEVAMEKDISFEHPDRYEMLCVGVKLNNSVVYVFAEDALSQPFWYKYKQLCDYTTVVGHNGKFDLNGLRAHCGKIKLGFDTMLAHYVLDERTGIHGLKYLAQEYLGAPPYDDEITALMGKSKDFGSVPKEILYKYNAYDVHCTYELKKLFAARLEELRMTHVHDFLIEVSNMLQDVERQGMTIDQKYLGELDYEYTQLMVTQLEALRDYGGPDFNPRSYQQIKKFLEEQGVTVPGTSAAILEEVIAAIEKMAKEQGDDLPGNLALVYGMLTTLLEYRKANKLYGTYIDGTKQRLYRGRVHPTYLIHGTTTGRLSARNPNTQNIASDKKIKRLFVPRDGGEQYSLVHADYSQAELRVLSYLAGDDYFRRIFNDSSRDLFDELIVEIYPGSIKELEDPAEWKQKRRVVKTVVYGLNYGRTEYGIAHGLGIDVEEALEIKNRFFSTIPEIIAWQEGIKRQVLRGDNLVTPFGRHRRYSLITKQNKNKVMNEALAFMPQSIASDCTVSAAIAVAREFQEGWGNVPNAPKIINLVHDDIIVDCHDADTLAVSNILRKAMIHSASEAVNNYVRFDVESDIGKSWDKL